jgi:hypothetical protein
MFGLHELRLKIFTLNCFNFICFSTKSDFLCKRTDGKSHANGKKKIPTTKNAPQETERNERMVSFEFMGEKFPNKFSLKSSCGWYLIGIYNLFHDDFFYDYKIFMFMCVCDVLTFLWEIIG